MTIAFQDNVLKFCLNTRDGKRFVTLLDDACFDLQDRKFIFSLVIKYLEKYSTMPSRVNLIEYFSILAVKMPTVTTEIKNTIISSINELYVENFIMDTVIVREEIIKFSQRKQTKALIRTNSDKVLEGDDEFFNKMLRDMSKIVHLAKDQDESNNKGKFILKDYNGFKYIQKEAHPTFLKALNRMTAAGGFKSPELIILMSQPKGFKTGVAINIAMEYMRDGLNGYYVDCENGVTAIESRMYQQMMQSTKRDLMLDENEAILSEMVMRYKVMGGDIKVDMYPAHTMDCNDVEENLQRYYDDYGWKPDFIIWDYPDLLQPIDKKISEKRLKIQAVYHDIIRIHQKWGCFGFGISQVSKGAVNKEFITMKDFAEDFGKAANAHGAFAICRTDDEVLAGLARLIPVMQREGTPFTGTEICYLKMDPDLQIITEIDPAHMTGVGVVKPLGQQRAQVDTGKLSDD